jgi:hypothetical protein
MLKEIQIEQKKKRAELELNFFSFFFSKNGVGFGLSSIFGLGVKFSSFFFSLFFGRFAIILKSKLKFGFKLKFS